MKAAVISQWGGPENLKIQTVEKPVPKSGEVLIKVRAFGLNHAESYFRQGLWGDVTRITGIECVGEVEQDHSGKFQPGQTVVTVVGGLGRDRNGSYAEYTVANSSNVVAINKNALSWADLAALPEVYATAWWCLAKNIGLKSGQTILIRGGTSAVGQAAINIGKHMGAKVLATTRNKGRIDLLSRLGADEVFVDQANLSEEILTAHPGGIDAALELVGSATLKDSLKAIKPGGHVCMAGFLGGLAPVDQFNPLIDMPSGVSLSFFGSAFVLGSPAFPIDAVPFQEFVDNAAKGIYKAQPSKVFRLEEIVAAHRLMESGTAGGKIVVTIG